MDILTGAGLAVPAGLNAYIPLLTVGLLARFTDFVTLSAPYDIIASDAGLIVITILLVVELFADAIPGVDSVNDVIQTVIRPATGAVLMLAVDEGAVDLHPILNVLIGGGLAGTIHALKSIGRPIITLTTAGIGNPVVSSIENAIALVMSILAIVVPILVLIGSLVLVVLFTRWILTRRRRHG